MCQSPMDMWVSLNEADDANHNPYRNARTYVRGCAPHSGQVSTVTPWTHLWISAFMAVVILVQIEISRVFGLV